MGATEEERNKKEGYTLWHSWCWYYIINPEEIECHIKNKAH